MTVPTSAGDAPVTAVGWPRVLVTDPIAPDGVAYLRQHATVETRTGLSPTDLLAVVGDYDGLVVRS